MSTMGEVKTALPLGGLRLGRTCACQALHRRAAAVVAWLDRAIGVELALRRSIRELDGMSERGLHDLGLSRWDVDRVTRHRRF